MTVINDPSGTFAGVTPDNHFMVESISKSDFEYQSLINKRGFAILSRVVGAAANDYVMTIECLSENLGFVINQIKVGGSASLEFEYGFVTDGTLAGTAVDPVNCNTAGTSGPLAAKGDGAVTGIVSVDAIGQSGTAGANTYETVETESGIILTKGEKLYVKTLDAADINVTVFGHFRSV